mmetsp:Transcript_19643/g.45407  ORF Transcript_19643/g.45407 Transcript_19643/m.45407 type:complete len:91 (+) Transcript_19643:278-550(+)
MLRCLATPRAPPPLCARQPPSRDALTFPLARCPAASIPLADLSDTAAAACVDVIKEDGTVDEDKMRECETLATEVFIATAAQEGDVEHSY